MSESGVDSEEQRPAEDEVDELDRLRLEVKRIHGLAFYLRCHPEDAEGVANEMMGFATYERDQYGHLLPRQKEREL